MGAPLTVYRQERSLGAAQDLDYGLSLLSAVREGRLGAVLRMYRPQPTVAFGQRDARLPGFKRAEQVCREQGFEPLIRKAGGRAAAYHRGCLVIDHIEPDPDAITGARARFSLFGELLAGALRQAGVDAAVGEIPGEYCPGEFSVHGSGPGQAVKLIGTAQRVVSGAWLFSSVIVVEDSAPLRRVLAGAYAELGLDWDPATAGSVDDLVPSLGVTGVEEAVLSAYAGYAALEHGHPADLLVRVPA